VCPVRAECLELSLRLWEGSGHHGIWGGTLEYERGALRRDRPDIQNHRPEPEAALARRVEAGVQDFRSARLGVFRK
jgi:Transcription factor WhiB